MLLFGPGAAFVQTIRTDASPFRDRDLVLLAIVPPDDPLTRAASSDPVWVLTDAGGKVAGRARRGGGDAT